MPKTFSDRLFLRRITDLFNKKRFEKQNQFLGSSVDVAPEWLHQSRSNYDYIFNNLDSYWPDWALKQYHPHQDHTTPPLHALSCLNHSYPNVFDYQNKPFPATSINSNGFIGFPTLFWGVLIQGIVDKTTTALLTKPELKCVQGLSVISCRYTFNQVSFRVSLGITDTLNIQVHVENTTESPKTVSLQLGILPYTNDGTGHISHLQYTSQNQMVINDQSMIVASDQANNILCTQYTDGNIFNRALEWDMILNQTCHHGLASGLLSFDYALPSKTAHSLSFQIHHFSNPLTPLFSIRKKRPIPSVIQSIQAHQNSPTFNHPTPLFTWHTLPSDYQRVFPLTQHFILTSQGDVNQIDRLFYFVHASLQLGHTDSLPNFLNAFFKAPITIQDSPLLSCSQTHLVSRVLILNLIKQYQFDAPYCFDKSILKPLEKQCLKDPFLLFLKHLTLNQFNTLLQTPHIYPIAFKCVIFLYLAQTIQSLTDSAPLQKIIPVIQNYLNIIQSNQDRCQGLSTFLCESKHMPLHTTLFYLDVFFKDFANGQVRQNCCAYFSCQAIQNDIFEQSKGSGFLEKNTLLLFRLSQSEHPPLPLLSHYLSNVNALGQYSNPFSDYHLYRSYPKQIQSEHALFLCCFFNAIIRYHEDDLHICIDQIGDTLSFSNLHTPYGKLSVGVSNELDQKKVSISHHFFQSPRRILLHINPSTSTYAFNTDQTPVPCQSTCITVPLHVSDIYLY